MEAGSPSFFWYWTLVNGALKRKINTTYLYDMDSTITWIIAYAYTRSRIRIRRIFLIPNPVGTVFVTALLEDAPRIRLNNWIVFLICEVRVVNQRDRDTTSYQCWKFDSRPDTAIGHDGIESTNKVDPVASRDSLVGEVARCAIQKILVPLLGPLWFTPSYETPWETVAKNCSFRIKGLGEFIWCLGGAYAGEEDERSAGCDIGRCNLVIALVVAGVWASLTTILGACKLTRG